MLYRTFSGRPVIYLNEFLRTAVFRRFPKLREATISFVMSFLLSAWNNSVPNRSSFIKHSYIFWAESTWVLKMSNWKQYWGFQSFSVRWVSAELLPSWNTYIFHVISLASYFFVSFYVSCCCGEACFVVVISLWILLFMSICYAITSLCTEWRTKCHTIDCAHNTFLLLQKHLTSGTELILIGWKIFPNEEHIQYDHRFASQPLANKPLHSFFWPPL